MAQTRRAFDNLSVVGRSKPNRSERLSFHVIESREPSIGENGWNISHELFGKVIPPFGGFEYNKHAERVLAESCGLAPVSHCKGAGFVVIKVASNLTGIYAENPEVLRRVDGMERYMLSKPRGPLYESLYASSPISKDRLRMLYLERGRILDIMGVRLPSIEAVKLLGDKWKNASDLQRLDRLREARADMTVFSGPVVWPYYPFSEVEPALSATSAGSWIERIYGDEVFIIYVRSIERRQLPPLESPPAGFREIVRRYDQETIRNARRLQILQESKFTFDSKLGERVFSQMQKLAHQTVDVASVKPGTPGLLRLASYTSGGNPVAITAAGWADYFNSQLIRQIPADVPALEKSIEDMAVMDLDCAEARRRRFDQMPQFREDRRNFLNYQVLDVFEKDHLAPQIHIEDAEVAACYRAHPERFMHVTGARGRLLRFSDMDGAVNWMRGNADIRSGNPGNARGLLSSVDFDVSSGHPIPGLEGLTRAILASKDGDKFGPIPSLKAVLVLVKESSEKALFPLAKIEPEIRAEVARQKLDEREMTLAHDWSIQFHIEDRIPYGTCGFPKPPGGSLISGYSLSPARGEADGFLRAP